MFSATPVFAADEQASDISDTSSVDSYTSEASNVSSTPIHHVGLLNGKQIDFNPGVFHCELCVPYATVFFSQKSVTVKYNLNVHFQGQRWSIDKRFSDLLLLHKTIRDLYSKEQSIGAKVSQAFRGSAKGHPSFPAFPARKLFGSNTNTSIKAVLARRLELNTYFQLLTNPEFNYLCSRQLNERLFKAILSSTSSSPRRTGDRHFAGSGSGGSKGFGGGPEYDVVPAGGGTADFLQVVERDPVTAYFQVPEKHRLCACEEWVQAAIPKQSKRSGASSAQPSGTPTSPTPSPQPQPQQTRNSMPHTRHEDPTTEEAEADSPSSAKSGLYRKRSSGSLWRREANGSAASGSLTDREFSNGTYVSEPTRQIIERMGSIPTLAFGLPNAKLCFDDTDPTMMLVVLRSKKTESRLSLKHRNDELLAFYGFVAGRQNDAIPDTQVARTFFQRYNEMNPLQSSQSTASMSSLPFREPLPGRSPALPVSGSGSLNGSFDSEPGRSLNQSPSGSPPVVVSLASLASGGFKAAMSTNTAAGFRAAMERTDCHNSKHEWPVANDNPTDQCRCTDDRFCDFRPTVVNTYVTKCGASIMIHPPQNKVRTAADAPSPQSLTVETPTSPPKAKREVGPFM